MSNSKAFNALSSIERLSRSIGVRLVPRLQEASENLNFHLYPDSKRPMPTSVEVKEVSSDANSIHCYLSSIEGKYGNKSVTMRLKKKVIRNQSLSLREKGLRYLFIGPYVVIPVVEYTIRVSKDEDKYPQVHTLFILLPEDDEEVGLLHISEVRRYLMRYSSLIYLDMKTTGLLEKL